MVPIRTAGTSYAIGECGCAELAPWGYFVGDHFNAAWNHHQKRNPHHWQYWLVTMDSGETFPLPMPDRYRREMLADWEGAGRAINGRNDTLSWYAKNRDRMRLHSETRVWVDQQLGYDEAQDIAS